LLWYRGLTAYKPSSQSEASTIFHVAQSINRSCFVLQRQLHCVRERWPFSSKSQASFSFKPSLHYRVIALPYFTVTFPRAMDCCRALAGVIAACYPYGTYCNSFPLTQALPRYLAITYITTNRHISPSAPHCSTHGCLRHQSSRLPALSHWFYKHADTRFMLDNIQRRSQADWVPQSNCKLLAYKYSRHAIRGRDIYADGRSRTELGMHAAVIHQSLLVNYLI